MIFGPDGRRERVVFIPDCDDVGRKKARALAGEVLALGVPAFVADLDPRSSDGFDVGDLLADALENDPENGCEFARQIIEARVARSRRNRADAGRTGASANGRVAVVRTLEDVPMRAVRWLWPKRVPLGKLTILAGLPGQGKSQLTCYLAAATTTGTLAGELFEAPADVLIYQPKTTWKTRSSRAFMSPAPTWPASTSSICGRLFTAGRSIPRFAYRPTRRRSWMPSRHAPAKEAGALLNVPHTWVLAEARADRIPHVRLGRYVRFDRDQLVAWALARQRGPVRSVMEPPRRVDVQ